MYEYIQMKNFDQIFWKMNINGFWSWYRRWGQGNFLNINCWNVILTNFFWIIFFKFCWAASNRCIHWNLTFRMNVQIYSWGEKSLEWMSEYICFGEIHKYLSEWIYSSINIRIYSNIRIFATHCTSGAIRSVLCC